MLCLVCYAALVAQLDRVFGYEPKGQGFESLRAHHRDVAQLGRARGLGPWGCRFKSCHLDHFLFIEDYRLVTFFCFLQTHDPFPNIVLSIFLL